MGGTDKIMGDVFPRVTWVKTGTFFSGWVGGFEENFKPIICIIRIKDTDEDFRVEIKIHQ